MSARAYVVWMISIVTSGGLLVGCSSPKKALSLLDKQKYEQAREVLDKTAPQDSLPVGAYYGYSLLYADSLFSGYDIDTAYQYVQQAINGYPHLEERSRTKLSKQLGLDTTRLYEQRQFVDSLAYERAQRQSSIGSYQAFIDHFTSARQIPQAIAYRNQLVFDSIQQLDTYPAYRFFMDTYPDAAQFPLAQQRYNTLAFQELTKEGNLSSYLTFLQNYPNSPYRPQAEQAIFEISTASNRLEDYAAFARRYPRSPAARRAVNILYHLYKVRHSAIYFLQDFPGLPYADSLRRVIPAELRTLVPTLSGERYGFIDSQGKTVVEARYDYLPSSYLCEGGTSDFLHVAALENNQLRHEVLTKAGVPVFSFVQPYDSAEVSLDEVMVDQGAGLLEVTTTEGRALRHKSGDWVISTLERAEEIELIPSAEQGHELWAVPYQFIKFRVGNQWGIKSFSGRTLLEPAYEAIDEYGPFLVLERGGQLAVTSRQALLAAMGSSLPLDAVYDDVALLEGPFLLAYQGEQETVIDEQLKVVVPLGEHSVVRRFSNDSSAADRWLLKRTETVQRLVGDSLVTERQPAYSLYPPEDSSDTTHYRKAFYNDQWLALQGTDQFSLIGYQHSDSSRALYDSIQVLGNHFVLTFQALGTGQDSVTVLMDQGIRRTFSLESRGKGRLSPSFRLLRTNGMVMPEQLREYLLVDPAYEPPMSIDSRGQVIAERAITNATVYPSGLIVVEQGNNQGLIDSLGKQLLPPQYDGISNYEPPGTLSLFKGKKFGLYQYPSGTLIEPIYESALTLYARLDSAARSLFVAKENGKYGIVTATNQRMTPFAFERVVYWNDTSALVKADDQWMIYRLDSSTTNWSSLREENILYQGIEDFSFFRENEPEQLLRIYANNAYGVLSSRQGELLPPTYDGISLLGDPATNDYLFFTEKYVSEADLYIMIYLNAQGKLVKRLALTAEQYDRLYCDGY